MCCLSLAQPGFLPFSVSLYLSSSATHTAFFTLSSALLFHWSSVLIQPLSLWLYFVPGISCAVQVWFPFFASKMTIGGIACPAAFAHMTMVTCPTFPNALAVLNLFASLSAITLEALGFNNIPVSLTLYTYAGGETRSSSFYVPSNRSKYCLTVSVFMAFILLWVVLSLRAKVVNCA